GHIPSRWWHILYSPDRHGHPGRCPELSAGSDAGSRCRTLPQFSREALLKITSHALIPMTQKSPPLFDWNIVGPAIADSFKKLNPRLMIKNPVMFVTMVGAALTT